MNLLFLSSNNLCDYYEINDTLKDEYIDTKVHSFFNELWSSLSPQDVLTIAKRLRIKLFLLDENYTSESLARQLKARCTSNGEIMCTTYDMPHIQNIYDKYRSYKSNKYTLSTIVKDKPILHVSIHTLAKNHPSNECVKRLIQYDYPSLTFGEVIEIMKPHNEVVTEFINEFI